jgi:hypothetical protein
VRRPGNRLLVLVLSKATNYCCRSYSYEANVHLTWLCLVRIQHRKRPAHTDKKKARSNNRHTPGGRDAAAAVHERTRQENHPETSKARMTACIADAAASRFVAPLNQRRRRMLMLWCIVDVEWSRSCTTAVRAACPPCRRQTRHAPRSFSASYGNCLEFKLARLLLVSKWSTHGHTKQLRRMYMAGQTIRNQVCALAVSDLSWHSSFAPTCNAHMDR